jgi:hypothetical protein
MKWIQQSSSVRGCHVLNFDLLWSPVLYHSFGRVWLLPTDQDETTWLASRRPPLTCCGTDHFQLSRALSFHLKRFIHSFIHSFIFHLSICRSQPKDVKIVIMWWHNVSVKLQINDRIQWLHNKISVTSWNHYKQEYILFIRIKIFINRINELSRRNLCNVSSKTSILFATFFMWVGR